MHAKGPVNVGGALFGRLRRLSTADDLDQRQQVDRVEGMADAEPFRMGAVRLQAAR